MTRVSVLIPAYNAEKYLESCLNSVLGQTYKALEVIVVDDGSRDSTPEIAEAFMLGDNRVRLIRQANQGVGAARNRGIQEATGEYIAPIDADDFWYPEKIAKQVAAMESDDDDTGLVYCWSHLMDADGRMYRTGRPTFEGRVFQTLLVVNIIGNASVPLFRASAVRELGGYCTREEQNGVQGCEDWLLSLRIAESRSVKLVRDCLVGYRRLEGCMSRDFRSMAESYEYLIRKIRETRPGIPKSIYRWSGGVFYMWLLRQCSIAGASPESLRWVKAAVGRDPCVLSSPLIYRVFFDCLARPLLRPEGHVNNNNSVVPEKDVSGFRRLLGRTFNRMVARRLEVAHRYEISRS